MILTTTNCIKGQPARDHLGIVGGRSGAYESSLRDARETALKELQSEGRARGPNASSGSISIMKSWVRADQC